MSTNYKYDQRGVSASKSEVHQAIKHLDKGLFPTAFCKILPDITGGSEEHCNLMHADTAGTKTSLAYLYWQETGNLDIWKGIAQDSIVMNLDDMACVGSFTDILLSSTIGRNKNLIPGEVIATIINAGLEFLENLREHGIEVHLAGGETADVGDIVRTIDVGYTAFSRMRRDEVIVNDIQVGDAIVGLASFGQTTYETAYNSGISSNGLTSARHDVLNYDYATEYPDSFDPNMPQEVTFVGMKKLTDVVNLQGTDYKVGDLLLSPTRTFLPVLKKIIDQIRPKINGIIHCTGGGQSKVLKFVENRHIVKNNLFPIPPVFELIQNQAGTSWREMYNVFNMGHRMEIYVPKEEVQTIIDIAATFNLDAQQIGFVEPSDREDLTIRSVKGVYQY